MLSLQNRFIKGEFYSKVQDNQLLKPFCRAEKKGKGAGLSSGTGRQYLRVSYFSVAGSAGTDCKCGSSAEKR